MIYDTSIIQNDTTYRLIELMKKYPISRTNDQAIMNLYFLNWKGLEGKNNIYEYHHVVERNLICSK
jgi:hypothetical protein